MKSLHLMVFVLLHHVLLAQVEINGKIIDQKTKQGLSFATLSIPGLGYNGIANSSGQFRIKIANTSSDEKLIVSAIGYETYTAKLKDLSQNNPVTIEMKATQKELSSVIVTAVKPKYSPHALMKKVINKMYRNYEHQWYEMTAYFQTTAFHPWEEKHHLNLYEGVVKIQDRGFDTHADSSIFMEMLKFRKGNDDLPPVSVSDSLSLSLMMRVITGQNHFNQVYDVYAADVIRQTNGGMFSTSAFRNDAVLKYDLVYDGVVTIDSVPCFRIIGTYKTDFTIGKNGKPKSIGMSYETYRQILPENTPERIIDSMYKKYTSMLEFQMKMAEKSSQSSDRDVFYVDQNSFALLRHEKESLFNNSYYADWVTYRKIGKKYYPSELGTIGPIFFRNNNQTKGSRKVPYFLSTMVIKSVNTKAFKLIPKNKEFHSNQFIENLEMPYHKDDWENEIQIPFDSDMYKLVLEKLSKSLN